MTNPLARAGRYAVRARGGAALLAEAKFYVENETYVFVG